MKRLLFFVIFSLLAHPLGTAGSLETNGARQEPQVITGRVFLGMFRSMSGDVSDKALDIVGKIYGPEINKGVVPDRETLGGLGRLLADYLIAHPEKMDEPIEKLVIEVLKDAPAQIEAQKIFWEKAYKAAQAYFSEPSSGKALAFYQALPEKRAPGLDFKGEVRLIDLIYPSGSDQEDNLSVLVKQMEAGDPYAIDIGFRLINISDGAFAEDLLYDLGTIIPKQPRLFLEKLMANQDKTEPPVLDFLDQILLDLVGWWEVPKDDPDETKYLELLNTRLDSRIKALKTVKDPHLKDIRDRCISILENMGEKKLE